MSRLAPFIGIIENITSILPKASDEIVTRTNILKWIVQRLKGREFDSNKQYASEILAILLQNSRGRIFKAFRLRALY